MPKDTSQSLQLDQPLDFERCDHVERVHARRDHQHGHLRAFADPSADRDTVGARQHDIEQPDVQLDCVEGREPARPVCSVATA